MDYSLVRPLGENLYELHPEGWFGDIPRVLVQVQRRSGRAYVTGLVVLGEHVDTAVMKDISVARVEAILNHPDLVEHQQDSDEQPIANALGALMERTEVGAESRQLFAKREPLTRPDGSDPDGFYRQVATAYNSAVLTTAAPAPLLAEEAGVPVATVHRWISEARRRGFLAPARKGRAG